MQNIKNIPGEKHANYYQRIRKNTSTRTVKAGCDGKL